MNTFVGVVKYLEALSIMPKEMPGIEKLKKALSETTWFDKIDSKKVIVVAGTNGKGSTCAILESLLCAAKKNVGFYSSPHLIDTTERIRVNQKQIEKSEFIKLFATNKLLIDKYQLTHFEALTLMAGDYFFSEKNLDYVLFEVGLGGTFDATNSMPHGISVITALSLDHTNILGHTLSEVASNKFGIIQNDNLVIHHQLPDELSFEKNAVQRKTNSTWFEAKPIHLRVEEKFEAPSYIIETEWGIAAINLIGARAAENAATALTVFEKLGFNPSSFLQALNQVCWNGRMQKTKWPSLLAPLYLSGDHNVQGVESLIKILADFKYKNLHLIVGIGKDKESEPMLNLLAKLNGVKLYLTETPFKGLEIKEYPQKYLNLAAYKNKNVNEVLNFVSGIALNEDLVVVTGSLYLVGLVMSQPNIII
ncbi:MAG: Mur ligase family protein [Pseudobdellovibrio sp.]